MQIATKPIAKTGLTKSNGMVALAVELAGSERRIITGDLATHCQLRHFPDRAIHLSAAPALSGVCRHFAQVATPDFGVTASEPMAIWQLHNGRFSRTFLTLARETPCESQRGNLGKPTT